MTWTRLLLTFGSAVLIVGTGFLAGMVWQARRSRAYARAQRSFLAGEWIR